MRKLIYLVLLLALAACSSGPANSPAQAVETYLNALVAGDQNAMIAASCAAWEEPARQEANAFTAVKLEMQGLTCQADQQDGDTALVTCSGTIIANYGAEDLQIDVAERSYQVVQENGAWRMCGYHE